ncbi:MAG: Fic family protein [Tepidisphaeraceae bacterium]
MRPLSLPPASLESTRVQKIAGLLNHADVTAFVAKANASYHHWEDLKRRPPPIGLNAQEAWTAVKLSRLARKPLPLADAKGVPFSYWLPENAYQTLHVVDRQGGSVLATDDAGRPNVFDEMRHRVLIDSLMEEAIATSQIEGAVTTRRVAKDLLRTGRKPKDKSEQMIVNGYATVRLIRERIDRPLSVELLHEIQTSMTRDTLDRPADAGRFRSEEDDVRVIDMRDGDTVFTPPPAATLPGRLGHLFDFANADPASSPFVHPLVRAVILHFWLAYEHPYIDGNGRTARALFYWSMLKSGYWLFEFLTISRIIHSARMQYYRSFLHSETDDNDLTYFLMFQFDVTRRALEDLRKRLVEVQQQQQRIQAIRLAARLNARQRALLDHALRHPDQTYTIESHERSHGIGNDTARADLRALADRGLLVEVGGKRPRIFAPAPDLAKRLRIK